MSRTRYTASYAEMSSRPLTSRVFTMVLLLTAVTLLVLTRAQHPLANSMRSEILNAAMPVVEWLSQPVTAFRGLVRDKNAMLDAFEENKRLHEEADTLRHWQSVAQTLKSENEALRALANYTPVAQISYVSARITGQAPGGYSSAVTINAGAEEGIKPFQPVVDVHGLIGRVIEVGEHSARVLLLSDSASRVPVVTVDSRTQALAAGEGANSPMQFIFPAESVANVTVGEMVVTTEQAGLIPGGIAVGTIAKDEENHLFVRPTRPLAQSEFVRIVLVQ